MMWGCGVERWTRGERRKGEGGVEEKWKGAGEVE
eukprot:gene27319-20928_t